MEKTKVKNVYLWGTFDVLHDGHFKVFEAVRKIGKVHVIVLPDERINEDKKLFNNENIRRENLLKLAPISNAYIDALPDIKCFEAVPPDIFCFGYDQSSEWRLKLEKYIAEKFPTCEFIKLEKYSDSHSRAVKEKILCHCGSGNAWKNCHGK